MDERVNHNRLKLKTQNGYIIAKPNYKPDFPGIYLSFISNDDPTTEHTLALIEEPKEQPLRLILWNNPQSEDYTEKIEYVELSQ